MGTSRSMCRKPGVETGVRLWAAVLCAAIALVVWPGTAVAQESSHLAGAGGATFASGATFNGVPLTSMRFGFGVDISQDGHAVGDFETTLLGLTAQGQPQIIIIETKASSGSIGSTGDATIAGASAVHMGAGTPRPSRGP